MKKVLMSVLFTIGILNLVSAQQTSSSKSDDMKWEKIGQTTINLSENYGIFDWDRDRVETVNANDKYSEIKFRAKDSKVNLTDVVVQYDNGKKEDLKMDATISANSDSKPLKLDTREDLDKVTFSFLKDNIAPKDDKAVVEIWGLKADSHSGMGKGTDIDVDVDVDTTHVKRK
jgi:hypothetical protein